MFIELNSLKEDREISINLDNIICIIPFVKKEGGKYLHTALSTIQGRDILVCETYEDIKAIMIEAKSLLIKENEIQNSIQNNSEMTSFNEVNE